MFNFIPIGYGYFNIIFDFFLMINNPLKKLVWRPIIRYVYGVYNFIQDSDKI